MDQERISLLSTIVNFLLAAAKLGAGILINSVALIADAIHSILDIFSSFITFLGIRVAKKPVDETHPYGFYRAEGLAGFIVTLILFITALWIIWEGINRFLKTEVVIFSFWAIGLMILSVILNEVMARLKFHYGRKYESLSLVADAEHSRADVLSSIGVLIGLILIKYYIFADAIVAILVGVYIVWESFKIGREITDSLLDVSNKDIEERIRKICLAHKIEIFEMKTRKIGGANFAELKINIDPKLRVNEVGKITKNLEDRLLRNIPELKYIVISIEPHEMKRETILSEFGPKICATEGLEEVGPKKLGKRIIIPLENGRISQSFGAKEYLVLDKNETGEILQKEVVKNPYFEKDTPHGARFVKAVSADKIFTRNIGPNAKKNLESFEIEIEIIPKNKKIENILKEIKT
jgi:cation diffusion facilitator family transporter